MSKKSKSQTNPMAELHFVAAVQLEQAVQLVGEIANEAHQVTLTEVSADEYKFHINYLPDKSKQAEIRGSLQRWQGTETKIDASGYVIRMWELDESASPILENIGRAFASLILFAGIMLISNDIMFIGIPLLILAGILIIGLIFISGLSDEEIDESRVNFRARDYLLQRIIDTFKAVAEVQIA